MPRCRLWIAVFFAAACSQSLAWGARSELIAEPAAAQHGLARPWFTQVQLDTSRARVSDIFLHEGVLYAHTDASVIHAIDAETGQTLWSRQVGDSNQPTMRPGLSHDLMAVVNGSHLYILNRFNGESLCDRVLSGAAGAGPAVSSQWAYVPMSHGLLTAFRLAPQAMVKDKNLEQSKKDFPIDDLQSEENRRNGLRLSQETATPLVCQSFGQVVVQPLVTRENSYEEYVLWPTDRGFLNLARLDCKAENALQLVFRMGAGQAIVGRPFYLPPEPNVANGSGLIIAASRDGFVHVLQDKNGEPLWRFSAGEAINEAPVAIDDRVYVSTQTGGMHALALKDGQELWFAPNAVRFLAASKTRVYSADPAGRLLILQADTGAPLDTMEANRLTIKLMNADTDRIYLATETGLIQCLHELEQKEPIVHNQERKAAALANEKPAVKQKDLGETGKPKAATPPKEEETEAN